MKKRISAILLITAMLSSSTLFTGCASDEPEETQADKITETTPVTETPSPNEDELGEITFDGEIFSMLTPENLAVHYCMDYQELTSDSLNDEIFYRNRAIENRFNLTIEETITTQDDVRTYLSTGETEHNIVSTRCVYAFEYAVSGLLVPVSDLEAINLDKTYWDKELTESISFGGQNFFAIGKYNLTIYDFISVLCFNKDLANDAGIENLYDLVNEGKWTFDKYNEVAKKTVDDVNGDGKMNINDSWGYVSGYKQVLPNFWISAGVRSVYKNEDDIPEFRMATDEKFFDVYEKILTMHYDNGLWMKSSTRENVPAECLKVFQENRSLFFDSTFFYIEQLRDMDTDFGIIPYPKWDENQEQYYNRVGQGEFTCIPKANRNFDVTGVVLESLACESAKNVIPEYYERCLQGKVTRDAESAEMLDLIFDTRVLDWGDTIFCVEVRDGLLRDMFLKNDRDLMSTAVSMEKVVNARITEAVESLLQ